MKLDKQTVRKIVFLIVFAVFVIFAVVRIDDVIKFLRIVLNALSPFIIGGCIAFVMNLLMRPLETLWMRLWKKHEAAGKMSARPVCLVISSLIVFGAVIAVLFIVIPEVARTTGSIIDMLPQYFDNLKKWWKSLSETLAGYSIVLPEIDFGQSELAGKLAGIISQGGQAILDKTVNITKGLFTAVFNLTIGFVFSIYILAGKEKLARQMRKLVAAILPEDRAKRFFEEVKRVNVTFSNFVAGQLIEAVIIGVLCFVGMLIFKMPYASVVSVLVAVTALIPVFGAFIGTAVGAFLILVVSPVKAIWFVIFIIVLQQIEGNVIYPHVAGRAVGLPGIWVLVAVTLGGSLFGIAGMLVSVPVSSLCYFALCEFVNKRLEEKDCADDEFINGGCKTVEKSQQSEKNEQTEKVRRKTPFADFVNRIIVLLFRRGKKKDSSREIKTDDDDKNNR